jgi:alkylation response protein AidB-like acyl-CoA dehydrogenase
MQMIETDPLTAAQRLEPLVTALRSRLDRERRLPDQLVQAIGDAGLFGMWLPRALGGSERPPRVFLAVIEELSRQDGSVGWCTAIAAGHSRFAGALPRHSACEIFRCGHAVLAGTLNPVGKATAVRGGYRVTGRWGYGSVIDHAQWVYGNCVTHNEDGSRRAHGDIPELRLCLFPRAAADVIDTWHVSGLRGTGSHDFAVNDLFVPEEHTVVLRDFTPVPTQPGPIYAVPMSPIFSSILAAILVGIARSAIEALVALAAGKTPMGSPTVLREKPLVQADLARAEALVRAGRALLLDEVEAMWQDVLAARIVTLRRRALVRLAACEAGQFAIQAVDLVYAAGGGTSVREDNRIERCWRDAHAAAQHFSVSEHSNLEPVGRVLFGLEPGTARF